MSARAAVGVQAPFSLIAAGGAHVAVKRQGQGQPVICLHATGHGGRDFEGFAAEMTGKGFETIMVDWPGQGASPPDDAKVPASAARYAQILRALIPDLGLSQAPVLLGNSIGGAAALSLAIEQPQIIKALVLCNPGGLVPLTFVTRLGIGAMVWFFNQGARRVGWFERAFALYYGRLVLPSAAAAEQRARIVAAGRENAAVMRDAWESFRAPEADLRTAAQKLQVPCLFAWASGIASSHGRHANRPSTPFRALRCKCSTPDTRLFWKMQIASIEPLSRLRASCRASRERNSPSAYLTLRDRSRKTEWAVTMTHARLNPCFVLCFASDEQCM